MNVDAYILVGGRSSRFGSPKAMAVLSGETLAGRSARIAAQALPNARVSFITAANDQFSPDELPGRCINDRRQGFGAWSAIDAAINDAVSEFIFVLACDLPLVSVEFITLLAAEVESRASFAAARQADGRIQPLCSFLSMEASRSIFDEVLGSEKLPPVTTLFERSDSCLLDFDDYRHLPGADRILMNINTRADLLAAERDLGMGSIEIADR